MAIQYAGGTIVNYTFASSATRRKLVDEFSAQLALAGWSYVSGEASADVLMQSATTPQGLFVRLRIYDPGSGNCAQITMKNNGVPAALTSAIAYMLPTDGRVFRIIANRYQFFFFSIGSSRRVAAREIIMGGVPYVTGSVLALLQLASSLQCGWLLYNGLTDTDTGNASTFRQTVYDVSSDYPWKGSSLLTEWMVNYTSYYQSGPTLGVLAAPSYGIWGWRYLDDSAVLMEPIIGWSSTSANNGERKYIGFLWDGVVVGVVVPGETTITIDGHTFMAITDQASSAGMTLYVAVD